MADRNRWASFNTYELRVLSFCVDLVLQSYLATRERNPNTFALADELREELTTNRGVSLERPAIHRDFNDDGTPE